MGKQTRETTQVPKASQQPDSIPKSRMWLMRCLILLVIAAALPFVFSLHGQFVLDDHMLIERDPIVQNIRNLPLAFTQGFLKEFDQKTYYYRPLITISYGLNHAVFGNNVLGYKLTNLLLHILATLLVFALVRRLTAKNTAALPAALLFAVHPGHTESVAWISGRTDLLATIFGVGAFLAFIRYANQEGRLYYLGSILLFIVGILCKEIVMVIPVMVVIYSLILRANRPVWWRVILEALPYIGVIIIYMFVRQIVLGYTISQSSGLILQGRLFLGGTAVLGYLKILFLPGRAEPIYDIFGTVIKIPLLGYVAWIAVAGLFIGAISLYRKAPVVAFAGLWLMIGLLPISNIIPFPNPIPAERLMYMPSIGFCILFGLAAAWLMSLKPKPILNIWPLVSGLCVAGVLGYCALQTYSGAPLWSNDVAIAKRMAERVPRFADVHMRAGSIYRDNGYPEKAVEEFKTAIKIDPNDPAPRRALAVLYRRMGKTDELVDQARILVKLRPADASAQNILGTALVEKGDYDGAIKAFQAALEILPGDPAVHFNIARLMVKKHDYMAAVKNYRIGLRSVPEHERARYELGLALRDAGKLDEAQKELKAVVSGRGRFASKAKKALDALRGIAHEAGRLPHLCMKMIENESKLKADS